MVRRGEHSNGFIPRKQLNQCLFWFIPADGYSFWFRSFRGVLVMAVKSNKVFSCSPCIECSGHTSRIWVSSLSFGNLQSLVIEQTQSANSEHRFDKEMQNKILLINSANWECWSEHVIRQWLDERSAPAQLPGSSRAVQLYDSPVNHKLKEPWVTQLEQQELSTNG